MNENGALPSIVPGQGLQKGQVGFRIEYGVPLIMKAHLPQLDGAQDLDALTLPSNGNFRGMPDSTPGGVERGILPEAGFIGKD